MLAINVNKSIYLPNEEAYIQMGVLNDKGHTICDAQLSLQITTPDFQTIILATEDGTIQYSSECGPNNVVDVPDYFAYYQTGESGVYQMKLTNLDTGYQVTDSFEVRKSVPFDIERTGPTRIYPPAAYEMTLKIKANQDFEGQIIETVPEEFEVFIQDTRYKIQDTGIGEKQIIWQDISLKQGEELNLKYTFDAPDISPYLYLLGPLQLWRFNLNSSLNSNLNSSFTNCCEVLSETGCLSTTTLATTTDLAEVEPLPAEGGESDISGTLNGQLVFSEARQWQIAADALTDTVRPDGDGATTNWLYTGSNHWDEVNDDVNEPTAGEAGDYVYTGEGLGNDVADEFNMDNTISGVASVTDVTMWMYARSNPCGSTCDTVDMDIYMGGSWTTASTKTMTTAWTWYSATRSGSWTQTDLNNLQLRVNRNVVGAGPPSTQDDNVEVATIYADVTYTRTFYLNHRSFRWQNDDGADVNSNSNSTTADTSLIMEKGERETLRIQVDNTGDETTTTDYKLQFGTTTSTCPQVSTWTDVNNSTAIAYSWGLAGSNGDAINATVTDTTNSCGGNCELVNGTWHEFAATTSSLTLGTASTTEFGFMIETSNAATSTIYCLRLYNKGANQTLDAYSSYGQLTIVSTTTKKYSKEPNASSLSSTPSDLTYYLDNTGYTSIDADDGIYDAATTSSGYSVFVLARRHTNNRDNLYIEWNGQTTVDCSSKIVKLQIYDFENSIWNDLASSATCSADNDFSLTALIVTSTEDYYSDYWSYIRVYQDIDSPVLKTDYFAMSSRIEQAHYRWRYDDGGE